MTVKAAASGEHIGEGAAAGIIAVALARFLGLASRTDDWTLPGNDAKAGGLGYLTVDKFLHDVCVDGVG
jgi:hypothetical protein